MSEKALAGLITFGIIVIISLLIYFNEHWLIRNFNDHVYDKIDVLLSSLKREVSHHLAAKDEEEIVRALSHYKRFNDVKLIAIFDAVGEVLFYAGDLGEIMGEKILFGSETLRYVPGKEVYEAISSIKLNDNEVYWILVRLGMSPYVGAVKRMNLLVFSVIVLLIIFGFIGVVTIFNRRILEPMSRVSELMQDIARGAYNVNIYIPRASAIYKFAESFNQMVRLIDEKERRLEKQKSQFKVIYEISRLGLEMNSVNDFFKKVVSLIRDEFNFLNVMYFTFDTSKKLKLIAVDGHLKKHLTSDYTIESGYGIVGSSALLGDVIMINDVSKSPQFIPLYDAPIASEMAVPIKKGDKVIGVLDISSDKVNAFTSEDIKIFRTVSEAISLALERFDSFMENIRLLFKLETVYSLTSELVLVKDVDKIFKDAVKLIYSILDKKELVVEIYERAGGLLIMKAIYGTLKEPVPCEYSQSVTEGVLGKAVSEKRFIYIPDIILEPEAKRYYKTTSSEIVVPLIVKGDVVGVINCESEIVDAFDNVDVLVLRTIADMLAIAVHNAQIYRKIADSESKYRAIFENSEEAIFRMDSAGRFIDVNPAFIKILGFNLEDRINFFDLFVSDETVEKLKKQLLSQGSIVGFNAQLKGKSGNILNVKISLRKFDSAMGEIYYDGIIVDLTEYLKILEKVNEAERLRELVQIAGGMAHEFNNIFASILGSAQLIKTKIPAESKIYHRASIIEKATARGAELVRKLVGYARGGKFKIVSVNLNELIVDVLKKIKLGDKISLRTAFNPSLPNIMGDRDQIFQALFDIIQNAIEAMENGGVLSIGTDYGYFDGVAVNDPELVPGEYVKVSISDTGVGMESEVVRRIFEPFFTTKRALGKSGLGLSMAYGVVKNHGGFITVSSVPGQGSKFNIFLPVPKAEKSG